MAISKTGIHVDESSSFTNPLVYEENGQVNSIVADSLTPDTRYYTRAYVIADGTTVYSQNTRSFKTATPYLTFINPNNTDITLSLKKNGSPTGIVLETSINNGSNWNTTDMSGVNIASFLIPAGKNIMLRGNNSSFSQSYADYYQFQCLSNILVSGNIMTLLDKNGRNSFVSSHYFCFINLFKNMAYLENDGIILPATTLVDHCYEQLFEGCSAMTVAPKLPATNLAQRCYSCMFKGSAIEEAPILPARVINATFPYYNMFQDCVFLVKPPVLVATSDTSGGSQTYSGMFMNCRLIESVEIYGDISGGAMFKDCSSLNTVIYHASTFTEANHYSWLDGVSASGSFINLGGATIPTGNNGIPSGWTEYNSL